MFFNMKACLFALCCFVGASQALNFNCHFYKRSYPHLNDVYVCEPSITAGSDSRKIESVSGTHEKGKTNNDVKRLTIDHQKLTTLPYNIVNFFPNLISIRAYNCSLKEVTALDFQPFPQMVVIDLSDNLITNPESDLFKFTPNLKWISFCSNQVSTIGRNLVTSLKNLEFLDFQSNKCINRKAENKAAVVALNADLPLSCPTVVVPAACPTPCIQRSDSSDSAIKKLNDEVAALKQTDVNQARDITQLRETNVQQSSEIQQQRNHTNVLANEIRLLRELGNGHTADIQQIRQVNIKQDEAIDFLQGSAASQSQRLQLLEDSFEDQKSGFAWLMENQGEIAKLIENAASQNEEIRRLNDSNAELKLKLAEVEENAKQANDALEKRVYDLEGKVRELSSSPGGR